MQRSCCGWGLDALLCSDELSWENNLVRSELREWKVFRSEQITKQNCLAMKSKTHCQRCLVYSECLIYKGSIQSKFPFPQFWPQRLHEASTTWHLEIPQFGFRAKRFWALLRKSFGSRLWQNPLTRSEQKSCHAYLHTLMWESHWLITSDLLHPLS